MLVNVETLEVKIIDFGSACKRENMSNEINQSGIVTTYSYSDPVTNLKNANGEYLSFKDYVKHDIFSVGMTFFYMITKHQGTYEYFAHKIYWDKKYWKEEYRNKNGVPRDVYFYSLDYDFFNEEWRKDYVIGGVNVIDFFINRYNFITQSDNDFLFLTKDAEIRKYPFSEYIEIVGEDPPPVEIENNKNEIMNDIADMIVDKTTEK